MAARSDNELTTRLRRRCVGAGHDLVMGYLFAGGIARGVMPKMIRDVRNPILSDIGRLFSRCPAKNS